MELFRVLCMIEVCVGIGPVIVPPRPQGDSVCTGSLGNRGLQGLTSNMSGRRREWERFTSRSERSGSDLPEPSDHLGCPSVAPEGETAERVARGVGLPAWDAAGHRRSTSTTAIEGSRPTFRSLRRLRRRATGGHPRDIEGSSRALHGGVGEDTDDPRRPLHRRTRKDIEEPRRSLPSKARGGHSGPALNRFMCKCIHCAPRGRIHA